MWNRKKKNPIYVGLMKLMLGALVIVVLNIVSAKLTQAETVVDQSVPLNVMAFNECAMESVTLQGTVDMRITDNIDAATGQHTHIHIVSKGTGVGLISGRRYIYNEESDIAFGTPGPPQTLTYTQALNHILNGTGPTDNFLLKITFHLTFNATGVPTAAVDNVSINCRG
jgi:hypothetical protein